MSTMKCPKRRGGMEEAKQTFLDLLEKIAEEQKYVGIVGHTMDVEELNGGGANITSALYRATLHANGKPDLKLFAKVALMSDHVRKMSPINCPFTTELYFYNKVQKKYEKIEEIYNVPEEHKVRMPRLYGSSDEYLRETLVLNDLTAMGFRNFNRQKTADLEYVTTAIDLLAKFHSLSLAFHRNNPNEFRQASNLFALDVSKMESMITIMNSKIMATALELVANEHREKLEKYLNKHDPSPLQQLANIYRTNNTNIIIHGDFKPSNLLHRRKNGKLEIVPVDFQMVSEGDPVRDLMYFIFTATDEAFRRDHYHTILDLYHERLREALARLQLDVENVYSETTYRAQLEENAMLGLIIAVAILPIILAEEEKIPTFDKEFEMTDFVVEGGELYKQRLNGIINNYVEWGLL